MSTAPQQLDFGDAFESFSKDEPVTDVKPATDAAAPAADVAPATEGDTEPTEQDAEGPAPAEGAAPTDSVPSSSEPEKSEPAPTPAPTAANDDAVARLADLLAQRQAAQPEPAPAPEPKQDYVPFTPDELDVLKQYEQDFPEVMRAEALRRREEYRQLATYMNNQWEQKLSALTEQLNAVAAHTQYVQIKENIPDYSNDLVAAVEDWATKQPTYLQDAYRRVIDSGTVQEVADLVSRFKSETGWAGQAQSAPAAAPAPAPAPKKEAGLPPAAKQAVAGLAPVSSKRTAPIAEPDLSDFDSAFAAFAGKEQ